MAPQQQLRPVSFRDRTRKRVHPVSKSVAWVENGTINIDLPKNGFLSAIYITLRGTLANGGNQTLDPLYGYPFNIIRRVRYDANIGNAELVNLSGFGLHLVSSNMEEGFATNLAGVGSATAPSIFYKFARANGNNDVLFNFKLPISLNSKENFQAGLINLQDTGLVTKLIIDCGKVTDIVEKNGGGAVTATFSGTFDVAYEYFEIPVPQQGEVIQRPVRSVIRTIENQLNITAAGELSYPIERQGFLLQLIQRYILDGVEAEDGDLTAFAVRGNLTEYIDRWTPDMLRLEQKQRSAVDYSAAIFHFDYWNSMGDLSSGDFRDVIATEAYTQLEILAQIDSGASLGVGTNFVHTIQRNYVELEKRGQ